MGLWANTADGWGSDPSSSGNGALASYLQSSNASAPQSNSGTQASDPSNSMPTSSIARTVQPSVSKLAYGVSGGLATAPAALQTYTPTSLATVLAPGASLATVPATTAATTAATATPTTTLSPDTPVAATAVAPTAANANIAQPSTFTAPAAVSNAVTYSGPKVVIGYVQSPTGYNTQISQWDPTSQSYKLVGSYIPFNGSFVGANGVTLTGKQSNDYVATLLAQRQQYANTGDAANDAFKAGANSAAYGNSQNSAAIQAFRDGSTVANQTNSANLTAATNAQTLQSYLEYATSHGGTLPTQMQAGVASNSLNSANDAALRQAALDQYQANTQSAAALSQGVAPVDTSTQDAVNNASMGAVSSRFSTNLMGTNIGAMSRLYANAVGTQQGTNTQLSDEDYADRFNQNLSAFNTAVTNQSTLDANATGVKLQSDITAMGDAVTKLQQQVSQLGTTAGQAVTSQLQSLQTAIYKYNQAVAQQGADNSNTIALAKAIIGTGAAITAAAG